MDKIIFKSLFVTIFLFSYQKATYAQLIWTVKDYDWTTSTLINISFEVENIGERTEYITNNYEIYLFDDNNYQYEFANTNPFLSIKVFPHRVVEEVYLRFWVNSDSKNLSIGIGSNKSAYFLTPGYQYDMRIKTDEYIYKANTYYYEEKYAEAVSNYESALYYDEDYVLVNFKEELKNAYFSLAELNLNNNNFEEAKKIYATANKYSYNENEYNSKINLCYLKITEEFEKDGDEYFNSSNFKNAIDIYEECKLRYENLDIANDNIIAIKKKLASANEQFGDELFNEKEYERALEYYSKAKNYLYSIKLDKKILKTKNILGIKK